VAEQPQAGAAPRAVLHDIRYSRYSGSLRPRSSAVASFIASSVRRPLGLRRSAGSKVWPFLLLAVAYLPSLAVVAVPLLVPQVTLQPTQLISYATLLATNSVVLLAFVATAIPSMLTRDRRDRVLSLYFATAVSWVEYLVGTALAALSLLAIIVLGPLLVLFVGSIATADDPGRWVADNIGDLPRLVLAAAVVVLFHTVLGLLVGSLTSRRVFAVGGYLAVVLVAPVVTVLLSTVLSDDWPLALDPASGPIRLAASIVDRAVSGPGALAWVVWGAVVVGGSAVVAARYSRGSDA
jgi:ABC-2 type transport system permease protein